MPVLSRCPLCRGIVPDVRGELRCPHCREVVLPSIRKLCVVCGTDVTRTKRTRDEAGEYYCHDCWIQHLAARGEEPGFVCNTCRQVFPVDEVYQDGDETVCHGCYQQRVVDPNSLLSVAAEAGDDAPAVFTPVTPYRRPNNVPWGLIAAAIALGVVLVVLVVILATRSS